MILRLFILLFLTACTVQAQLKPGLVGEYFKGDEKKFKTGKPFLVRVDPQVSFREVSGDFYGSKLSDRFVARWNGVLKVPMDGPYQFYTFSDDGSRLYIDDQLVVDNWGAHSFTKKNGSVELKQGEHALRIEFMQGGGGAGCVAGWMPPGKAETPFPASVLFHRPEQAKIAWDEKAWKKINVAKAGRRPNRGVPYDKKFGPCLGAPVRMPGNNIAFRGLIARLNEDGSSAAVFDGDTLRMAAAWSDGALTLEGLPFTGGHGSFPHYDGTPVFQNRVGPGWAHAGVLKDPRESREQPPLGPLPRAHAKLKGWYLHGWRTVFHYSVGGSEILESPSLLSGEGEAAVLMRDIQVIKDDGAEKIVTIADAGTSAFLQVLGDGVKTETLGDSVVARIPAGTRKVHILYSREELKPIKIEAQDLTALTRGGPKRWTETVTTKGALSKDEKQAYVIDRVTLPDNNPYGIKIRVGGMDFFKDGKRAAISTWDGDVWIVDGIDAELNELKWTRFATGLHEALGLKIVDDVIYTVADDQITRFHDLNQDGEADYYETFNNDWDLTSGFHAFCFDLHTDPAGNFYFAFGSPVRGGGRSFERMGRHHGSILRVSPDGSKLERYASGLRAPNGMGVSPTGQVTSGDNEGTFVPRCPINWIKEGDFLGVIDAAENLQQYKTTPTKTDLAGGRKTHLEPSEAPKPLAWLSKNVDNSGGGQFWVDSERWGPFKNMMLHGSYGRSTLYLVMAEDKGGQMQGGVVKFPVRFTSSCMRGRFNPADGQLYIAGLKGWQSNAAREGGFDRVRYTGKKVAMPSGLEIKPTGMVIHFTCTLDEELAEDPESYAIKASDIRWTHDYGSKEYQLGGRESGTYVTGSTRLDVKSAELLSDGKSVFVEVPDMQPAHIMEIDVDLETADGDELISKIHNTVHVTGQ